MTHPAVLRYKINHKEINIKLYALLCTNNLEIHMEKLFEDTGSNRIIQKTITVKLH